MQFLSQRTSCELFVQKLKHKGIRKIRKLFKTHSNHLRQNCVIVPDKKFQRQISYISEKRHFKSKLHHILNIVIRLNDSEILSFHYEWLILMAMKK